MYASLFESQRSYYKRGHTRDIQTRIEALRTLKDSVEVHKKDLINAFQLDLNKHEADVLLTEIMHLTQEIDRTISHIHEWAKDEIVKTPITHFGATSRIVKEPYGQTLIIAPWNYPFNLAIGPLVGAIAAGNTVILKPSEHTPNVAQVIAKIIDYSFVEEYVAACLGGIDTNQALLKLPFDYIFFTGSTHVGKIVMKAAAEHLTPVTLELGGKSPAIIYKDADLKIAAKRLAWAKFINGGQTCVAPDYVLVHHSIKEKFINILIKEVKKQYTPQYDKGTFTRIVSENHFERVRELITGDVRYGGRSDADSLLIEPTIIDIDHEGLSHQTMDEEIFGPVLPIMSFNRPEEVVVTVNENRNPLALYVFTENTHFSNYIIKNIPFGGGCINDAMFHLATPHLPFGGRGNSGMGSYHGKYTFDTFVHEKSILDQTTAFDIPVRYPKFRPLQKLLKYLI